MDVSTGQAREAHDAHGVDGTHSVDGVDDAHDAHGAHGAHGTHRVDQGDVVVDHGEGGPEAGDPGERRRAGPPQPGQLTTGWRAVTALVWALAFVAFIAVWKTSRELGLSTWWLGPLGAPRPWYVTMLPFLPPVAMVLLVAENSRRLPWAGLAGAASLALVGVFDLSRVARLGVVELAVAAATALVAVVGLAGRYRPAPALPSEG